MPLYIHFEEEKNPTEIYVKYVFQITQRNILDTFFHTIRQFFVSICMKLEQHAVAALDILLDGPVQGCIKIRYRMTELFFEIYSFHLSKKRKTQQVLREFFVNLLPCEEILLVLNFFVIATNPNFVSCTYVSPSYMDI